MQAFLCKQCPLAFEIGGFVHWDLTGTTNQMVCMACGVMHRLIFHEALDGHETSTGTSELYALPSPIRQIKKTSRDIGDGQQIPDYEWPYTKNDWVKVAEFENRQSFEALTCHHCQTPGRLVSRTRPQNEFGRWPAFRDANGKFYCPICKGPIETLYCYLIN